MSCKFLSFNALINFCILMKSGKSFMLKADDCKQAERGSRWSHLKQELSLPSGWMTSFFLLRFYCSPDKEKLSIKLKTTKQLNKHFLFSIASFLISFFIGGEVSHVVVVVLDARLTTGSWMRICVPMENSVEGKQVAELQTKGNRSDSCWELLLQGGETQQWCLRAWNLASFRCLLAPAPDELALRIPPAHTFPWRFGWALPQPIFNSYTFHD